MITTPTRARLKLDTPIGPIALEGDDETLTSLLLPNALPPIVRSVRRAQAPAAVARAADQLDEYFAGERTAFDLPLETAGTPFQRSVWAALAQIPHGRTLSYGELAATVGRPRAFRAVGAANGANPIPIVLPCHRVLASGGKLGGYGGGLDVKRRLLALEGVAVS